MYSEFGEDSIWGKDSHNDEEDEIASKHEDEIAPKHFVDPFDEYCFYN